jgi:hypothetical protein
MEKSSNMKEEIYKIVKYQTKLAESTTRDQQDLYRYKLTQHISNLTNYGVKKEAVRNMLQGGSPDVMKLLESQKDATIKALDELEASSKSGQADLENQKAEIEKATEEATKRHESVVQSYKEDLRSASGAMDQIQDRASILKTTATLSGSLGELTKRLTGLLAQVKDPSSLAGELSEAMNITKEKPEGQKPEGATAEGATEEGATAEGQITADGQTKQGGGRRRKN